MLSLPDPDCYVNTSCAVHELPARDVLAALRDDAVFTRPSPLLSPAQTSGRWAPYVATLPVRAPPGLGLRAIGGGTSVVVPASLRTGFNLGLYHGSPGA